MGIYEWVSLGLGYATVGAISALMDVTLFEEDNAAGVWFWFWPLMWIKVAYHMAEELVKNTEWD